MLLRSDGAIFKPHGNIHEQNFVAVLKERKMLQQKIKLPYLQMVTCRMSSEESLKDIYAILNLKCCSRGT